MPRRLFLALLFLVAAPLVLLGWASATAIRVNEREAEENLVALLSPQLDAANQDVGGLFGDYAGTLDGELDSTESNLAAVVERLRTMRRTLPIVRQGIIVDPDGRLIFPPVNDSLDDDAVEVFAALPGLVGSRPTLPAARKSSQSKRATRTQFVDSRWQQWYMSNGAQAVYWRLADDGTCVGVLLERSRWMADVIASLPSQPLPNRVAVRRSSLPMFDNSAGVVSKVVLVDESKRPIYRWGLTGIDDSPLVAVRELPMPLSSWQFRLFVDPALTPKSSTLPIYLSLLSIGVILLAAGGYVLTAVRRQIADAKTRVSFAGQVSHELRTPLTNIRLYTELAENDLAKLDVSEGKDSKGKASIEKRLKVIDHESRRLQRLVSGVLEMIRSDEKARGKTPRGKNAGLRLQAISMDGLLNQIVQQFQPSFAAADLTLQTRCQVVDEIDIDPDVVEMVLVNLLSNVEKYVPAGGRCLIRCELQPLGSPHGTHCLIVCVDDDGPGIAAANRRRIFQPFQRLDDSINAPGGTGIGLTIARSAAERHGGDLSISDHPELGGASFELRIPLGTKP